MQMKEKIRQLASAFSEEALAIRHHLHAHPELSMQEQETSAFVRQKLESWGIACEGGFAVHGLKARLTGKTPAGKVVAARADMDALPILEKNQVDYGSQNPGVMHACGHDVHMTGVLGAAWILQQLRNEWEGTVLFLFQPSEEKNPGGASLMIRDGVLRDPRPSLVLAQHVFPELKAGEAGFFPGKYMASADEIYITVKGRGGHAALPHLLVNPLFMAGRLLQAFQQFIEQTLQPHPVRTVLNFGTIHGNGATNVVPDEVTLSGTFRAMDDAWRFEVHRRLEAIAASVARESGGAIQLRIEVGYPCLVNDEKLTNSAAAAAADYLGAGRVKPLLPRMSSEDFAFFSAELPVCFYRLGTNDESGSFSASVHTPVFNIDESALTTATGLMAWLLWSQLQNAL